MYTREQNHLHPSSVLAVISASAQKLWFTFPACAEVWTASWNRQETVHLDTKNCGRYGFKALLLRADLKFIFRLRCEMCSLPTSFVRMMIRNHICKADTDTSQKTCSCNSFISHQTSIFAEYPSCLWANGVLFGSPLCDEKAQLCGVFHPVAEPYTISSAWAPEPEAQLNIRKAFIRAVLCPGTQVVWWTSLETASQSVYTSTNSTKLIIISKDFVYAPLCCVNSPDDLFVM